MTKPSGSRARAAPGTRTSQDPTGFAHSASGIAWCRAAAGIGLARLRAHELTGYSVYKEEANIAIPTSGDALQAHHSGAYVIYSLCLGQFGNAELLLDAALRLDEDQWLALPTAIASEAASRIEGGRLPWPCGVTGAGETPGLMLGLAGIGHFYLRLHDARKAPSLLTIGV